MADAPTVAFVLDRDQMRGTLRDLQRAINKGARTVLLVSGTAFVEEAEGDITESGLGHVPVPDVFISNTIFTVAFANEPEETLKALGAEKKD